MITEKAIREGIRKVLAHNLELHLEDGDFLRMERLDEIFGMDSVAIIEFVVGLEREFGITIPSENLDIEILRDVGRLQTYLRRMLNKQSI